MNQTKKRLTIINLAISITDIETIQLQVLKLGLLKSDDKIREILSILNAQNYAQAQRLISEYIEAPNETILQRTSQKEENNSQDEIKNDKDQSIIDEFDLFTETTQAAKEELLNEVDYSEFLDVATKPKKLSTETVNYDALLNISADEILPDNIELNISKEVKDDFFDTLHPKEKEDVNEVPIKESSEETFIQDNAESDTSDFFSSADTLSTSIDEEEEKNTDNDIHEPIPYIDQKFIHMCTQYPPVELTENRYFSVENWLLQLSSTGYTKNEIETHIKEVNTLANTNLSEAGQLLLATASTESKYAKFSLARALYTGKILQKNVPEAVEIIKYLVLNDDYPEAICDLAQFYENGIEVDKDKKKAEALYQEAMDLGIKRAMKHYERIRTEKKSLFSAFKA